MSEVLGKEYQVVQSETKQLVLNEKAFILFQMQYIKCVETIFIDGNFLERFLFDKRRNLRIIGPM